MSVRDSADRPPAALRFRGLPPRAKSFFEALEREPCPDTMPGGDRAAYAAHVLSPLKALVADLGILLADVQPPLGLEARVGASLDWPDGADSRTDDCPVRRIRLWDADSGPRSAPALYAAFSAAGIDVGVSGPGHPAAAAAASALPATDWRVESDDVLRVEAHLPWAAWLEEPGFAQEIADRFRELLPVFDAIRHATRGDADPFSETARTAGER